MIDDIYFYLRNKFKTTDEPQEGQYDPVNSSTLTLKAFLGR